MILHKLILKNFRQFRGVQQIDFSSERDEKGKNVTVIYGENGRGKTSIFRAIVFCLYGDRRLSQDEEVSQKELFLVNSAALEELKGTNRNLECSVELNFSHREDNYSIKRTLLGMYDGEERIEQLDKTVLASKQADGNTVNLTDPEEINTRISSILDSNVKEYFLFDGEKIQRLTLASVEQRHEIARGIRNLLNVDALEKAIKATVKLKKTLNDELAKRATGELKKIIYQLGQYDDKKAELKSRILELEQEYVHAETEKRRIDKNLEQYKEIIHLLRQRVDAEKELKAYEDSATGIILEMQAKTGKAALLLVSDVVERVFLSIDKKKQKGEIPSEIRKDLIDKILNDKKCICQREILPGSEPYKQILIWKNKVVDSELESSTLELWRHLGSIRSHREDYSNSVDVILQKYGVCKSSIDRLRVKIEDLNKQIGSTERKDAADLEKARELIERKQIMNAAEQAKMRDEVSAVEVDYARLKEKRKELERQQNLTDELVQRGSLTEDTITALQAVYDQFTSEIKHKISAEANKYFTLLLDAEGRETLKKILVNDDYSLQVHDRWGKPFLANISAGQRQIMSISFIAALARVAAADDVFEMPFFMDTPFGRLSSEHRKNLVEKVPTFCAQWILLATDTEFSRREATLLRRSGRWGAFYTLQSDGPGSTKIKQRKTDDANAILVEALEE